MIIWVTKAGARNWDELRASALPAAAGGLVVIAWFVPLLVYATDGFVWRFGIWGADDFTSSGQPGSQIDWVFGISFTVAAGLAMWAAFDVVRSRGRADGWPRRQRHIGWMRRASPRPSTAIGTLCA